MTRNTSLFRDSKPSRRYATANESAWQLDVRPWGRCAGTRHSSSSPSLRRSVAAARLGNSSSDGFSVMTSCRLFLRKECFFGVALMLLPQNPITGAWICIFNSNTWNMKTCWLRHPSQSPINIRYTDAVLVAIICVYAKCHYVNFRPHGSSS